MTANWSNRTLFHGDNLAFLRGMNSETIDLIATDPPFNKGRDFHATPESLASGAKFQDRWSWEQDVHQEWVDQIVDDHPRLMEAIESARHAHSDGMGAFMCFMAVRLLEMRRLLKPTGSMYLHCDATASHYLKACMDAIFGWKNFRNDIVWQRYAVHSLSSGFDRVSDSLLHYSRSDDFVSNSVFGTPTVEQLAKKFPHTEKETGRRFQHVSLEQSSNSSSAGEDRVIGDRVVVSIIGWRWTQQTFDTRLAENRHLIYWTKNGRPRYKIYADEYEGVPIGNIWTDVPYLSAGDKERVGYPTQKPLALYERIIQASSNEGDMVLDPFAGCATTCVAAERLQRQWVGIDLWDGALDITRQRMEDNRQLLTDIPTIYYADTPPTRTDAGETAAPDLKLQMQSAQRPSMSRAEMREQLLAEFGPVCRGCDHAFHHDRYLELDHIVPRSEGGSNDIDNRTLLCGPCNRLKSNTYTLTGLRKQNKRLGFIQRV